MTPRKAALFNSRTAAGVFLGAITAVVLGVALSTTARALWPAYAIAEPTRAYSLTMLVARLVAGACIVLLSAIVATRIARDGGRTAWWLGGLFFAISFPHHVFQVWAEYPVWYHVVYLAHLIPLSGWSGQLSASVHRPER